MIDPQSGQLGASACGLNAIGVSGCALPGVNPIGWAAVRPTTGVSAVSPA
jgi:hypothetical protein